MPTCNTAFKMSPEDEDHTQHTYVGNLKTVLTLLLGTVNYSANTNINKYQFGI